MSHVRQLAEALVLVVAALTGMFVAPLTSMNGDSCRWVHGLPPHGIELHVSAIDNYPQGPIWMKCDG